MTALFYAHSGIRYLILLAGLAALAMALAGQLGGKAAGKPFRIVTSSYLGLVYTQVLLGLGVLLTRPYFPALIGHIAMMVLAVAGGQALVSVGRRKSPTGFLLPLIGIVVSLLLIVGGIYALPGRTAFSMTASGG